MESVSAMVSRSLPDMRGLTLDREAVERVLRPLGRATQLPPQAFVDPEVFAWERETLFRGWVCAGHVSALGERGAFLTAGDVFVIAGDDGRPRAFVNACRHRGARLLEAREGTVRRLQCPYHAWTYRFDGTLTSAPFTDGLEDFDCPGLLPVRMEVVEGLVMIDVSGTAGPVDAHVGDLRAQLARYELARLVRARRIVYDVHANWKAIGENYSECLHCPGVHPELNRLSPYLSGEGVEGAGAWCGGSMALAEGVVTMGTAVRPRFAGAEPGKVLYFALFPNALVSLHPDYVMLHTLWPKAAGETEVVCDWLRPRDLEDDLADAVEFWDQVNREDWEVCRLTQLGLAAPGVTPGRYTTQEHDVHAFDRMVAERYLSALSSPSPSAAPRR
jgi:Rieske 2Fe-2S family protein